MENPVFNYWKHLRRDRMKWKGGIYPRNNGNGFFRVEVAYEWIHT